TQLPPPAWASLSSTGESCLHGSHQSAQKSRMTGVLRERSRTADWKLASVTSMSVSGPPPGKAGAPPLGPPAPVEAASAWAAPVWAAPVWGRLGAAAEEGAGVRSALRSTAPRVKIDGVVRGSLMVT